MKIWKKALIYLAIMALIVMLLNNMVPNPYKGQRVQVSQVVNNPTQYRSLTFGRSHACSLNYDYYSLPGMNFALGGRDLASIEYLCDYLLPKCDSLEEVVLFISFTSLYFDNTAMSQGNLNDARKALYYSVSSMRPIDVGDINNFMFGKFLTFIQADHGWSFISKHEAETNSMAKEGMMLTDEEMIVSGEKQSTRDILDRQKASQYNPNIAKENEARLRSIIEKCQKCGLRVMMVQAPYYFTYTERVPQDMITELDSIVRKVSDDRGVLYCDFSKDERFDHDISLWSNSDHLNRTGQKLFTEIYNELVLGF